MMWYLVLVFAGLFAECAFQVSGPIQWMQRPMRHIAVASGGVPAARFDEREVQAQLLTISDQSSGRFPDEIPYFTLKDDHTIACASSGWCVESGGRRNGDVARINLCDGSPAQRWDSILDSDGRHLINLQHTNLCLDVVQKGSWKGTVMQLRECDIVATSWVFAALPPLSPPSQRHARHVLISLVAMAGVGMLSLGLWLRQWQAKPCAAKTRSNILPLVADQGGVSQASSGVALTDLTDSLAVGEHSVLRTPKWISQTITTSNSRNIRMPVDLHNANNQWYSARREVEQKGFQPTVEVLANDMVMSVDKVRKIEFAKRMENVFMSTTPEDGVATLRADIVAGRTHRADFQTLQADVEEMSVGAVRTSASQRLLINQDNILTVVQGSLDDGNMATELIGSEDSHVDIRSLTVKELKAELKLRGLKVGGNKEELVRRLEAATAASPIPADELPAKEFSGMNVDTLVGPTQSDEAQTLQADVEDMSVGAVRTSASQRLLINQDNILTVVQGSPDDGKMATELIGSEDSHVDIRSLTVNELKAELKLRGLKVGGNKEELVRRLEAATAAPPIPADELLAKEFSGMNVDSLAGPTQRDEVQTLLADVEELPVGAFATSASQRIPRDTTAPSDDAFLSSTFEGLGNVQDCTKSAGDVGRDTDFQTLRRRIEWLNGEGGGFQGAISYDRVLESAGNLPCEHVMHVLSQLVNRKSEIRSPNNWVCSTLRAHGGTDWRDADFQTLRRRIEWLNGEGGGFEGAISYDKVLESAGSLPCEHVMKVLSQLVNMKSEIKSPNNWVCSTLQAPGGTDWRDADFQTLRRRIKWLNGEGGGFEGAISYGEVLKSAGNLPCEQVMKVLSELVDMKDMKFEIKSPNNWVCSTLRAHGRNRLA